MKFDRPIACLDTAENVASGRLRLALLGATGSIGRQVVDIVERHPDLFEITAMSVNTRVDEALELCRRVNTRTLAVCNAEAARTAARRGANGIEIIAGAWAMDEIAGRDDVDTVVTATVGYSGLRPTIAAMKAGKDIALANKETLVVAGDFIRRLMDGGCKSRFFPIDSEHSAIAQCLAGEDLGHVSRLIVTASGGPFRNLPKAALRDVTAAQALRHPNWSMGAKITVDSATLMNKAFELVEAHYLFGIPADRIGAVVHPQSIVHSMVEFDDGAIKAQLGAPDMHLPIAYALGMNRRIAGASRPLSVADYAELTFERPDTDRFPCLGFASTILERRGNSACVINAANEVAVDAFLHDRIRFTDIPDIIDRTLLDIPFIANPQLDDFIDTNRESRLRAMHYVEKLSQA